MIAVCTLTLFDQQKSTNRCSYKLSKILRIRKATTLYGDSNQNDDFFLVFFLFRLLRIITSCNMPSGIYSIN